MSPPSPWRALGAGLLSGGAALVLLLSFVAGKVIVAAQTGELRDGFRIHQSDLRGTAPGGGLLIRCHLCNGSRIAPRFIHGDTHRLPDELDLAGHGICPECQGSGTIAASRLGKVTIVPDHVASSYRGSPQ